MDGRVQLGEDTQGPLEVVQDSGNVLVLDRGSGVVTRIDPAQLSIARTESLDGARLRIVASGDSAWVVDQAAGVVQRIDPVTLAAEGKAVTLASRPLGAARADEDGILWVVLPDRGEAVPIDEDKPGEPVKAGQPGEPLRLTVAMGRAAVVNIKAGTLTVLSDKASGMAIRLPGALSAADPARVLVPENNASPLVPLLAPETGVLVVANVESGVVQAAELDLAAAASYGPPQAHGPRVYVPDTATGSLLVYNTTTARFDAPIRVTGISGQLDVYTRGDRLWVNDQANATAAVVDDEGVVHLIDKYDTKVPGAASSSAPPTATSAPTTTPAPGPQGPESATTDSRAGIDPSSGDPFGAGEDLPGSSRGSSTGSDAPQDEPDDSVQAAPSPPDARPAATVTVTAPPAVAAPPVVVTVPAPPAVVPAPISAAPTPSSTPPRPAPVVTTSAPAAPQPPASEGPPGRPKAQTGTGTITVTFAPSGGATPDRYELEGAPARASVKPTTVSAKGPFRFEVGNLACDADTEYTFKVVAVYGAKRYPSAASPAVRPCVAPGSPTITDKTRSNHQITLTWKAPADSGLKYQVTWRGAGSAPDGGQVTTDTSLTIRGLTNGSVYDITVTAVNNAGASPAAKTTVDMTPPKRTLQVHHNHDNGVDMGIRTLPDGEAGSRAGTIPPGYNGDITVHCQVKGSTERRLDGTAGASAIWDKVTYKGVTGYVSDVYIDTTNSGENAYSPELWQCE